MENSQSSAIDGFLKDPNDVITVQKADAAPFQLDDNTLNLVANAIQSGYGSNAAGTTWTYPNVQAFNNYDNYDKPKELLLLDGTKILKTVHFGSILRLEERTRVGMHFSFSAGARKNTRFSCIIMGTTESRGSKSTARSRCS